MVISRSRHLDLNQITKSCDQFSCALSGEFRRKRLWRTATQRTIVPRHHKLMSCRRRERMSRPAIASSIVLGICGALAGPRAGASKGLYDSTFVTSG